MPWTRSSNAAIDKVETVAQELGFEIVSCYSMGEGKTAEVG